MTASGDARYQNESQNWQASGASQLAGQTVGEMELLDQTISFPSMLEAM
jgi:hypothetical protein